MLDEAVTFVPRKSTISRWRLLMDGAFMLMMRRLHMPAGERSFVRYIMADSSMQHGRDFEHVVSLEINGKDLVNLLETANHLASMWSS